MRQISVSSLTVSIVCALTFLQAPQAFCADTYVQTNLVSNIAGLAQSTDPNLRNPWGLSYNATSPFWAANAASNTSTLYQGNGSTINSRVVGVPGGPTGTVINSTTGFIESNGRAASFMFSTLGGSIYSWNASDTDARQVATVPGASFTGLALANNGSGDFLFATSTAKFLGSIEVFDSKFGHVSPPGLFIDPSLPPCQLFCTDAYVPFNIQNINGLLYVEYANFQLGRGAVSVFDANGNFVKSLIPAGEPHLNEPWGIAIAPAGFGGFAGSLLVGNFGSGDINAFDPVTGAFRGTVSGPNGRIINSNLWALSVRTGGTFDTSAVYFTAGINGQKDGLFGKLNLVAASTVVVTDATPPAAAQIGVAYTRTFKATGGTPPYATWRVATGTLPLGLTLNATTGVLSGTPVGVEGTFSFNIAVNDSVGATGSAAFQATVQQPSPVTGLSRIGSFAQIASGGGWKTTMTLSNSSAAAVTAQINFYADDGSPMIVPLAVPKFGWNTSGRTLYLTVNSNDSIVIESGSLTPSIAEGWADVQANGALTGSSTFSQMYSGSVVFDTQAPIDSRLSPFLLLNFDNTFGYQTALGIANQSPVPDTITATLLDQNGVQLGLSQMTLPGFGHAAFFLSSLFPQSVNKFGSIQFTGSSGIAGVGFRFSPTSGFQLIPITR